MQSLTPIVALNLEDASDSCFSLPLPRSYGNGPTAVAYLARRLGFELTPSTKATSPSQSLNFAVSGAQSGHGAGRAIFDEDPTPCANPSAYYYYHSGHPSTAVHKAVRPTRKRSVHFRAAACSAGNPPA